MPTEIKMPQLGESVTEGTVGRWLKHPGDQVERDEPLIEIISDKVDTELPAPSAGTLLEIRIQEGETVRVGTVLGLLGAAAEALPATPSESGNGGAGHLTNGDSPATPIPSSGDLRKPRLSPVVARMAAEHGLDVSRIPGTGIDGRVSKQDVLRFLEQQQVQERTQPEAAAAVGADPTIVISEQPAPAPAPVPAVPAPAQPPALPADTELLPLTPMRRTIAGYMLRAVQTIPHVTTVMEVDLSRILQHREQQQNSFAQQGVRLTLTAYLVQATIAALQAVPVLNGSFTDEGIIQHRRQHIGVAVALDEGLLVPVVRDADEKNLLGLARAIGDLTERARTRRLRPEETQGGTFTMTNHGVSGSLFATPIINQGQGGILGIGAVQKRAVVISQGGVDAIAIRPMCYCGLTFDHRLCDGVTADTFLSAFKRFLEEYG